jgi:hypothetical protein
MQNPYASPNSNSAAEPDPDPQLLARRAGWWLCVAGFAHTCAMNLLSPPVSIPTLDYSALLITLLGIFVYFRNHFAETITRLIGSFTLIGCLLVPILLVAGMNSKLTYGSLRIDSPHWWQTILGVAAIALTFGPPWYLLQLKVRQVFSRHNDARNNGIAG